MTVGASTASRTPRQKVLILGARSQSRVVGDWVCELDGIELTHFVENMDRSICDTPIMDLPVLWVDALKDMAATHRAVCVFESPKRKHFIETARTAGVSFFTPIHPSAVVSSRSTIGEGCIISPAAVVAGFSEVGPHVFLNRGALIGHDTTIGPYSTISPGAAIAGFCSLAHSVVVGMGAQVINGVTVGPGSIIGAGAVVTKDVPWRDMNTATKSLTPQISRPPRGSSPQRRIFALVQRLMFISSMRPFLSSSAEWSSTGLGSQAIAMAMLSSTL